MFKRYVSLFLKILTAIVVLGSWAYSAYDPFDARHQLITQVRADFATEIEARKAHLGTCYGSVALVDIAREHLESGVFNPSDPDWAKVIRYVLSGYGYSQGVIDTSSLTGAEKPTARDLEILKTGYALSSAYLKAQGDGNSVQASQVFTQSASARVIATHVAVMNKTAASVPADVHALVGTVCQIRSLNELSHQDAWWAHERFWAAGGVIDPRVPGMLRTAHAAFRGTQMGFLNDLATKLDAAIRAIAGVPTPAVVEDLVRKSQQILFTLAAGTPNGDNYSRLNPASAADWQIIRKAMFLALSVTSDPEKAGRSFISAIYDCGKYYHKKTDATPIKEYYWKLEAYGCGFSSLWKGLKAGQPDAAILPQLIETRAKNDDPLYWFLKSSAPTSVIDRSPVDPIYKGAYRSAMDAISASLGGARDELAAALALHPRLNYQQAFKTLYPDLTTWAEYHTPSERAENLVGAFRTKIAVPEGTQFKKIYLKYVAGKWRLVGDVSWVDERILWQQGAAASQAFTGEFKDARGTHLFSFSVNGATATIKTIGAGYVVSIGGAGSTVTIANGDELGMIETSAYPNDIDYENFDEGTIEINGAAYNGGRGILSARRGSVLITAPKIDLSYAKGFEVRTHTNGAQYKFMVPCGQGIQASNVVFFKGDEINLSQGIIKSGVGIFAYNLTSSPSSLITAGSCLDTGYISVSIGTWFPDTRFTLAGMPDHDPYRGGTFSVDELLQMHLALTPASARGRMEAHRALAYHVPSHVYSLNTQAPRDLLTGAHVWGIYGTKASIRPDIHMPSVQEIAASRVYVTSYESSGGYGSDFGGGFGGFGSRSTGRTVGSSSWGMGSKFASLASPAISSPMPSSMRIQGADFGISAREGGTSVFASMTIASPLDSWSLGGTYSTGDSGRSLSLFSKLVPVDAATYVSMGAHGMLPAAGQLNPLQMLHLGTSAAILRLSDGPSKMNAAAILGGIRAAVAVGDRARTVGVIVFKEAGKELAKLAGRLVEESAKSATGGPNGEEPEGKKPEDEDQRKKKPYKIDEDTADPSLPVGSRHVGQQPKYLTPNEPTNIGGRDYSGHALDRMRERGLLPTAVEDTIKNGVLKSAEEAGKSLYHSPTNNISVVTDTASGRVVTVRFGVF